MFLKKRKISKISLAKKKSSVRKVTMIDIGGARLRLMSIGNNRIANLRHRDRRSISVRRTGLLLVF